MPKVIILPPDGDPRIEVLEGLAAYQAAVGGDIQSVPFNDQCLICDEDGKLKRLPANQRATDLCRRHKIGLHPADQIVGTVFLIGPPDEETGEYTDVSHALIHELLPDRGFKLWLQIEDQAAVARGEDDTDPEPEVVSIDGLTGWDNPPGSGKALRFDSYEHASEFRRRLIRLAQALYLGDLETAD